MGHATLRRAHCDVNEGIQHDVSGRGRICVGTSTSSSQPPTPVTTNYVA